MDEDAEDRSSNGIIVDYLKELIVRSQEIVSFGRERYVLSHDDLSNMLTHAELLQNTILLLQRLQLCLA